MPPFDPHRLQRHTCSPEHLAYCEEQFAIIRTSQKARNMLEFVQWSTHFDHRCDDEEQRLVFTGPKLAACEGKRYNNGSHRGGEQLQWFSDNLFPLNHSGFHSSGFARTIRPDFPAGLLERAWAEKIPFGDAPAVWFHNGRPVTRADRRAERQRLLAELQERARLRPDDHPLVELLDHLNGQPQQTFANILKRNWPRVMAVYRDLPSETDAERRSRQIAYRNLRQLGQLPVSFYGPTDRTSRIYSFSASVNFAHRSIRKAAFAGCHEIDQVAAQLTVVARIWNIPELEGFLAARQSVWEEFYEYLGVGEWAKPTLKAGVFACLFLMNYPGLVHRVAHGHGTVAGIGVHAARRFFDHPIMRLALEGRERARQEILTNGYGVDAFDRRISLEGREIKSVICEVVQSYEQRIMAAILPIIKKDPNTRVVSYLHDGITVHCSDSRERDGRLAALASAIEREGHALGIPTWAKIEPL
jgi:hypothetical protein